MTNARPSPPGFLRHPPPGDPRRTASAFTSRVLSCFPCLIESWFPSWILAPTPVAFLFRTLIAASGPVKLPTGFPRVDPPSFA